MRGKCLSVCMPLHEQGMTSHMRCWSGTRNLTVVKGATRRMAAGMDFHGLCERLSGLGDISFDLRGIV